MKSQQIQQYQRLTKELDDLNKKYQELRKKNQEIQAKIKSKDSQQKAQKPVQNVQKAQKPVQNVQKAHKQQTTKVVDLLPSDEIRISGIECATKFDNKHIIYAQTYNNIFLFNVDTKETKRLFTFELKDEVTMISRYEQRLQKIIMTKNNKYIVLVGTNQISIFDSQTKKEVDVIRYFIPFLNENAKILKVVYIAEANMLFIVNDSEDRISYYDLTKKQKVIWDPPHPGSKTLRGIKATKGGGLDKKEIFYNPYKKEILIPHWFQIFRISAENFTFLEPIDFSNVVLQKSMATSNISDIFFTISGDIDGQYLYLYDDNRSNRSNKFDGIVKINLMNYKMTHLEYPKNQVIEHCINYKKNQIIVVKNKGDNTYISIDTFKDNKLINERVIHEVKDAFVTNFSLFGKSLYYQLVDLSNGIQRKGLVKIELETTPDIPKEDQTKIKDFDKSKFPSRRNYDESFKNYPKWKLRRGRYGLGDYIQASDRNISLGDFRGDPFTASQSQLATYVERKSRKFR